jgi:hypothetical protein
MLGNLKDLEVPKFFGICHESCPEPGEVLCTLEGLRDIAAAGDEVKSAYETCDAQVSAAATSNATTVTPYCNMVKGSCWKMVTPSEPLLYRCVPGASAEAEEFCIDPPRNGNNRWSLKDVHPLIYATCKIKETETVAVESAQSVKLIESIRLATSYASTWFGDLQKTRWIIFLSGVFQAIFLGFLWLHALKKCAPVIAWLTLILTLVANFLLVIVCYTKAGLIGTESQLNKLQSFTGKYSNKSATYIPDDLPQLLQQSEENTGRYKFAGTVMGVCFIVLLVLIISLRKKIDIAVRIMQEASKVMEHCILLCTNDSSIILYYALCLHRPSSLCP